MQIASSSLIESAIQVIDVKTSNTKLRKKRLSVRVDDINKWQIIQLKAKRVLRKV